MSANRVGSGCVLRQIAAICVVVAATGGFAGAGDLHPAVDLRVSGAANRIVLDYRLGAYETQAVKINGAGFVMIRLPGEPSMLTAGAPSLPKVCRSIIIPDDARMAVRVLDAEYTDVKAAVAPAKGSVPRTVHPADVPYHFSEAYQRDAFTPGLLVELGRPYILRDHRGLVVELHPFQYKPVAGMLRVYTRIRLEVTSVGPGVTNVLRRDDPPRALSWAFHELYRHHFVNYRPALRYPPLDETGDMLIIAHDPWVTNVQPLAAHKIALGMNASVVAVSAIGNDATAIRNYIQNIYETSDLAFVLLVGDAAQVAPPLIAGAPADPTYAQVAGDDTYPDIMIGRFSAQCAPEVDTQVQRTIEYEVPGAPGQPWFWRGSGIGADANHLDNIRDELLAHGYSLVDRIYDPGATAPMVASALNSGRGIVNYIGQGSTTFWGTSGFSTTDVDALTNDSMLPFIFSVASLNGGFDVTTCFAEAWLRAQHNGEPTGAIGAYMASSYQYWLEPVVAHSEFIHLYVSGAYTGFGTLCFAGGCRMMDEYAATGADMFNTWILFGDPSLRVVGSPFTLGDLDCDGDVDFDDINPFVLALSGEAAYLDDYPDCRWLNADIDGDGDVDFDDIDPFVTLLGS